MLELSYFGIFVVMINMEFLAANAYATRHWSLLIYTVNSVYVAVYRFMVVYTHSGRDFVSGAYCKVHDFVQPSSSWLLVYLMTSNTFLCTNSVLSPKICYNFRYSYFFCVQTTIIKVTLFTLYNAYTSIKFHQRYYKFSQKQLLLFVQRPWFYLHKINIIRHFVREEHTDNPLVVTL